MTSLFHLRVSTHLVSPACSYGDKNARLLEKQCLLEYLSSLYIVMRAFQELSQCGQAPCGDASDRRSWKPNCTARIETYAALRERERCQRASHTDRARHSECRPSAATHGIPILSVRPSVRGRVNGSARNSHAFPSKFTYESPSAGGRALRRGGRLCRAL